MMNKKKTMTSKGKPSQIQTIKKKQQFQQKQRIKQAQLLEYESSDDEQQIYHRQQQNQTQKQQKPIEKKIQKQTKSFRNTPQNENSNNQQRWQNNSKVQVKASYNIQNQMKKEGHKFEDKSRANSNQKNPNQKKPNQLHKQKNQQKEKQEPQEILYTKQNFKVLSQHPSYIRVQLQSRQFASIDITEANENWLMDVFSNYPVGKQGVCRIIAKENGCYWASVRETFLNDKLWTKCLHPIEGNQLSFKKYIINPPYDVRTLLYKKIQLELGQVVIGYVTGNTHNGSFVKIGYNTTVLVKGQKFMLYRPVILMITQLDKLQGTTELSMLSYSYQDRQIKIGDVVDGVIYNVKNERAAVKILGTLKSGELEKNNAEGADSEEGWWANKLFKIGDQVTCLVIGNRSNRKGENVIRLSNIKELIETEGKRRIELGELQADAIEIYHSFEKMANDSQQNQVTQYVEDTQNKEIEVEGQIEEEVDQGIDEEEQNDEDDIEQEQEEQEQEQDEDIEIDQVRLDSRAEYEKKILSNPNSAILWIEFAAFVAESENIESARQVMERALRVINQSNEAERLNIYTAYLNLEYSFGTEENVIDVFKKGCQNCNGKKLYQKLINIYRKGNNMELTLELSRQFTQKYRQSTKSWMEFLQSLIEWQQSHENDENPQYQYKDVLNRAMQSLVKKKQIKLLAFYGRLQFQHNQVEEGKTTFETILKNNVQRTDLWSQYIDLAIKFCPIEVTRSLFVKALKLNRKPKKMKFLFKKYLEFESAYGNEESVQKVRYWAEKWVSDYMQKDKTQEDDEEDSD